ncbi:MAG: TetR/AcrR family transcriptional regulator [Proteobacteria bacterium]|nr:TetR/AcrR family transcriptional regulator [Pseudomonadota bacterium]
MSQPPRDTHKRAPNYHHGDLKNTLIVAAAELIEERNSSDFTIIEAARRAGVSSGAPYRHFKGKEALLLSVAELGFLGLRDAIANAISGIQKGTIERIIAAGHAYMRYIIDKQAFYDLMWGELLVDAMASAGTRPPSAFEILVVLVDDWLNAESIEQDSRMLSVQLVATAHGLVSLQLSRRLSRIAPDVCIYDALQQSAYTFLLSYKALARERTAHRTDN